MAPILSATLSRLRGGCTALSERTLDIGVTCLLVSAILVSEWLAKSSESSDSMNDRSLLSFWRGHTHEFVLDETGGPLLFCAWCRWRDTHEIHDVERPQKKLSFKPR